MYNDINRMRKIKELYELIDELAVDILKTCNVSAPIKDMEYIVSCFGGKIQTGNFLKPIVKTGKDSFNIYISENSYPIYNKFHIAARLGDLLLHTNYLINREEYLNSDVMVFKEDNGIIPQVYQSNEFAYGLLMPRDLYKEILDNNTEGKIVHTAKIAEYFDVPISTASSRGKRLGLIKD